MIPAGRVGEAHERIKSFLNSSPVTFDQNLNCYIKWENHQVTGSFKIRGALNKVLSLSQDEMQRGLVSCSAGNHGQGVAYSALLRGVGCTVFASDHAAQVKLSAMTALGADVRFVRGGYVEAETTAMRYAGEREQVFVSPYNDVMVVCGQGTLGIELSADLANFADIRTLVVPVGGGGLLSGLGIYLSGLEKRPALVGVQSTASPFAYQLLKKGSQEGVVEMESIAEGLAGEIAHDSITIPMLKQFADDILLVSEEEIEAAIRYAWEAYHEIIEGSAAVGLAARLTGKISALPAVLIVTGGNIQPSLHKRIALGH